jgi:membrane protein implicated in regulation of membrane protease activity
LEFFAGGYAIAISESDASYFWVLTSNIIALSIGIIHFFVGNVGLWIFVPWVLAILSPFAVTRFMKTIVIKDFVLENHKKSKKLRAASHDVEVASVKDAAR